jgi:hypothetical protein
MFATLSAISSSLSRYGWLAYSPSAYLPLPCRMRFWIAGPVATVASSPRLPMTALRLVVVELHALGLARSSTSRAVGRPLLKLELAA